MAKVICLFVCLFVCCSTAEQNIRARIAQLQDHRRFGMTTLIAVEHAEGDRRRKEVELAKKAKEINYYGPRRVRDEARNN